MNRPSVKSDRYGEADHTLKLQKSLASASVSDKAGKRCERCVRFDGLARGL